MKNKLINSLIIASTILMASGCAAPVTVAGNYTYKTECLGNDQDGTQIVKAWGSGKRRAEAVDQAMKNAVNDVLFKGITEGINGCEMKPIVSEVNARQKFASYFNSFFTDKGAYLNFVEPRYRNIQDGDLKSTRSGLTAGIILRIYHAELKQKMAEDGIIRYY
ncbi:MAG TPA: hypothetical protein DIC44_00960 [Rikenellaceae bacterium]|nr:hypothetical protein [Rikenellaceae bacterium]